MLKLLRLSPILTMEFYTSIDNYLKPSSMRVIVHMPKEWSSNSRISNLHFWRDFLIIKRQSHLNNLHFHFSRTKMDEMLTRNPFNTSKNQFSLNMEFPRIPIQFKTKRLLGLFWSIRIWFVLKCRILFVKAAPLFCKGYLELLIRTDGLLNYLFEMNSEIFTSPNTIKEADN